MESITKIEIKIIRMMIIFFYFFLLTSINSLGAQSYTIQGFKGDSIYMGTDNILIFDKINCANFKFKIEPKASLEFKNCRLTIIPYKPNVTYKLLIWEGSILNDTIILHSAVTRLLFALKSKNSLETRFNTISAETAKELEGIKVFNSCPWLRNACNIRGYYFYIWRNGIPIYNEKIETWELTKSAKNELSKVKRNDIIVFQEILWVCPGDDNRGGYYIELKIK